MSNSECLCRMCTCVWVCSVSFMMVLPSRSSLLPMFLAPWVSWYYLKRLLSYRHGILVILKNDWRPRLYFRIEHLALSSICRVIIDRGFKIADKFLVPWLYPPWNEDHNTGISPRRKFWGSSERVQNKQLEPSTWQTLNKYRLSEGLWLPGRGVRRQGSFHLLRATCLHTSSHSYLSKQS